MTEEQLRKAIALVKQGKKSEAIQIVKSVLQQNRNNVNAWWLMANLLEKPEQKVKAAQRVLALKSEHAGAKKLLASLKGSSSLQKPEPESTAAPEESQYNWSKLEAKKKPKKSGGFPIGLVAGCLIGVLIFAGIGIAIATVLSGINFETARIRDSYEIDNSSLEAQLETTIEQFFILIMEPDFTEANVFFCFAFRSSPQEVEEAQASVDGRGGFDVEFEDGVTVSNIFRDGNVIEAGVRGDITLISTGESEGARVNTTIEDFLDEMDVFDSDKFRFVYEDNEWRICPSN